MIIIYDDAEATARELDSLTEARLRKIAKDADALTVLIAASILHDVGKDDAEAHPEEMVSVH